MCDTVFYQLHIIGKLTKLVKNPQSQRGWTLRRKGVNHQQEMGEGDQGQEYYEQRWLKLHEQA
jgi:hypothetical protein